MSTASIKITHLTSVHKLIVPLSIKWADLEEQIRNIFSIPSNTPFLLRYRDEDGDLITLNSDLEFEQVLCTGARVRFLLTLPQDEVNQPDIDWDVSSTSSFDTISEEPVFVQQETDKDEDAAYFVDMDTEDANSKLQNGSTGISKDKQKEKEVESMISSNGGIEVDIFHDFPNLLLPSSQKQQKQPEELDQEMSHVKMIETVPATANEPPIVREQPDRQDKQENSKIEELSTKFEKIVQQCFKVLGDDPEMLDKVDSAMNHILENTPMYIGFALNMLNSAKNQKQNTESGSSNEDVSQQDHIENPPDMPGSFPNNTPLFQFRSGDHCQYLSSSCHPLYPPPPPLNMLPPPPRVGVNRIFSASPPPPQPLNPPFTLTQPITHLPPFPGSFPLSYEPDSYNAKLSELYDMGFKNRDSNLSLLRKYNGDIETVVENIIISQKDNSGNSGSASSSSRSRLKPYSHRSPGGSGSKSTSTRPHLRYSSRQACDLEFTDDSAMSSD